MIAPPANQVRNKLPLSNIHFPNDELGNTLVTCVTDANKECQWVQRVPEAPLRSCVAKRHDWGSRVLWGSNLQFDDVS